MKHLNETTIRLTIYALSLGTMIAFFTQSQTESYIPWIFAIIWNTIAIIDVLDRSKE